jgi:hypothetical protein
MVVEKRTPPRKRAKASSRPPPLERLDDDWFDLAGPSTSAATSAGTSGVAETPPPDYDSLSSATLRKTPFAISDVASSARRS